MRRTLTAATLLPLLFLLLLPCLLLWRVVFLGEAFVPADLLRDIAPWRSAHAASLVPWNPLMWDGVAEFYPWRSFAASSIQQGYLPLWNPHQFCGTPFVANSQSAVFYPLNVLFYILPVPTAFGVSALAHLVLTGLLLYGFLRSERFRLGAPAALFGAVVWQLSAWQVAWLALPTFLCVSAWLPLALWLTDRAASRLTFGRAAALGACLGVMLLAGHVQIAFYCLLLFVAYAIFRVVPRLRADRRLWLPLLGCTALAVGLMLGFAAPQALPTLELSRVSHRAGAAVTGAGYQGYVRLALPAINLVTLFLPGFFGNPTQGTYWGLGINGGPGAYMENACSVGVLALLLAVYGAGIAWRRSVNARFFSIAAIVALLMALGTPLDALLYFGIPGFAQSGSPGRILVVWTFCAAVLSALGVEALLNNFQIAAFGRILARAAAAFALFFALSLGYAAWWLGRNAPGALAANLRAESDLWRLPLGILLGVAAAICLARRGTVRTGGLGAALVMLAALELLASGLGFNRTTTARNIYPVTPGIAFLQQHAGYARIMPLNRRWSLDPAYPPPAVLPPNAAMAYGLNDTQGYDSLLTGQYAHFAMLLNGDGQSPAPPENGNMIFTHGIGSPEANMAAVRYLVSLQPLSSPGLTLVMQDDAMGIYENANALPRARLSAGQGTATIEAATQTRLSVQIENASRTGELVIADQWYPGWRCRMNGQSASIAEGPAIFRTVRWQRASGDMATPIQIVMEYRPTAFRFGLYGLCLALLIVSATATAALAQFAESRRR